MGFPALRAPRIGPTALAPQVFSQDLTASLSFIGSFAASRFFLKSFNATLFPSGGAGFPLTNLVSYWKLDETSGTRFDSYGTNDLSDNNIVGSTTGKVGNAAQFVAANAQFLSHIDNAALSMGDIDFSVTAWAYFDTIGASGNSIVSKYHLLATQREYAVVQEGSTFKFYVSSDGLNTTTVVATSPTISTGQWYFIVAWHDASANSINIQVNNGTVFSAAHTTGVLDGTSDFYLGRLGFTFATYDFDGRIDEVSLWKRILSSTEITALWNGGAGATLSAVPAASLNLKTLKTLAAIFSPIAALSRRLAKSLTATLSFVAVLTKKYLDAGFSATLSFIGNLATSKTFIRALTATLNFTGALSRRTGKALGATLLFIGAITKNIRKTLTAALSFVGNLATSKLFVRMFSATLSFVGNLVISKLFIRAFTATLNFSGTLSRRTGKALAATLSFIGNLATSFIAGGGHLFFQSYTATLSFSGAVIKNTRKALSALLWATVGAPSGTVWNSDGTPTSIQNLHDNFALDGDTITMPSGTFSWTTGVVLSKSVTVSGNTTVNSVTGVCNDQTIIVDNLNRAASDPFFDMGNASTTKVTRVTGITFTGAGGLTANMDGGAIIIAGGGSLNRIDHCHFTGHLHQTNLLIVYGSSSSPTYGVADHLVMDGFAGDQLGQNLAENGRSPYGDQAWTQSMGFGSGNFFFMEDCYLDNAAGTNTVPAGWDSATGGKYVIRYCRLFNIELLNHGTESSGRNRGGRGYELYNNVYNWSYGTTMDGIRSGTLIAHDNIFTGVKPNGWGFQTYRMFTNFTPWGGATGDNPWDVNDPVLYGSGTTTSGNTTSLTDTSASWTTNQWVGYVFKRISDGEVGTVLSNTATTATFATFGSPFYSWAAGQAYQIHRVPSVVLDQPCRGRGDLITGDTPVNSTTGTPAWPNQDREPCYSWNNVYTPDSSTLNFVVQVNPPLVEGVDYFSNTPMPGYTPYAYPHPLTVAQLPWAQLIKQARKSLTAVRSFVGNLATNLIHGALFTKNLVATLSFSGVLTVSKSFLKAFTATLSFTGVLFRRAGKAFSATLVAAASLIKRVAHIFSAILAPVGALIKAIRDAGFSATLSFAGALTTAAVHFFTRNFTATLSFVGNLGRLRGFARVLAATLNMSGAIRRQTIKRLSAALSFSAALRKAIRKVLAAVLAFAVFFFKGGAVEILAGMVTKAGALIGLAGSTTRISKAGSQLEVREAESGAEIPRTGSQLRVERTK
jgi:hypothetical protein